MAVACDKASLLVNTICDRARPLRDLLLLAGLYYTSKKAVSWTNTAYSVFKTFVLPAVWPRNFRKEYGQWAGMQSLSKIFEKLKNLFKIVLFFYSVVTGCTRGIGLGYVHALAKRGMDIIMIGRDSSRLEPIAAQISKCVA